MQQFPNASKKEVTQAWKIKRLEHVKEVTEYLMNFKKK
jgi:hypothetical protein